MRHSVQHITQLNHPQNNPTQPSSCISIRIACTRPHLRPTCLPRVRIIIATRCDVNAKRCIMVVWIMSASHGLLGKHKHVAVASIHNTSNAHKLVKHKQSVWRPAMLLDWTREIKLIYLDKKTPCSTTVTMYNWWFSLANVNVHLMLCSKLILCLLLACNFSKIY